MRQFNSLLKLPELVALNVHTKQAQMAQNIWKMIAPENLAEFSHATAIKNQQFTILAHSNAVAAKIKLFIPSLLIQLEKQECEVTSIRVKVQVKSNPQAKPKALKKLSSQAALDLKTLAEKLTGTPLGQALARLASKAD